jgi:hypothetical protein
MKKRGVVAVIGSYSSIEETAITSHEGVVSEISEIDDEIRQILWEMRPASLSLVANEVGNIRDQLEMLKAQIDNLVERRIRLLKEGFRSVFADLGGAFPSYGPVRVCASSTFFHLFLDAAKRVRNTEDLEIVSPFQNDYAQLASLKLACDQSGVAVSPRASGLFQPEDALLKRCDKLLVFATAPPDVRLVMHIFGAVLCGVQSVFIWKPDEFSPESHRAWDDILEQVRAINTDQRVVISEGIF